MTVTQPKLHAWAHEKLLRSVQARSLVLGLRRISGFRLEKDIRF